MQFPLDIKNTSNMPRYFWHPSIVYVPEGFAGHSWWMAQTPFPPCDIKPYRDRYELPCIHYSDDGLHWLPIPNNPIDDITKEQEANRDFMSDPHLIYRDNHLELYYRLSIRKDERETYTILLKRISYDGLSWPNRQIVADLRQSNEVAIWGKQIISQSILWTGEEYVCWYVDASHYIPNRHIRCTKSRDGIKWEVNNKCILLSNDVIPWHIDVQYYEGKYMATIYDRDAERLSIFRSDDGLKWQLYNHILTPARNPLLFYSGGIYRSSLVKTNDSYSIFFSGMNKVLNKSYIGRMDSDNMQAWKISGSVTLEAVMDVVKIFIIKILRKISKSIV